MGSESAGTTLPGPPKEAGSASSTVLALFQEDAAGRWNSRRKGTGVSLPGDAHREQGSRLEVVPQKPRPISTEQRPVVRGLMASWVVRTSISAFVLRQGQIVHWDAGIALGEPGPGVLLLVL